MGSTAGSTAERTAGSTAGHLAAVLVALTAGSTAGQMAAALAAWTVGSTAKPSYVPEAARSNGRAPMRLVVVDFVMCCWGRWRQRACVRACVLPAVRPCQVFSANKTDKTHYNK